VDYVAQNKKNIMDLSASVFRAMGPLFEHNIPNLVQQTGFTRPEIIHIFSRFKALCQATAKQLKRTTGSFSYRQGVNFDHFKKGIPELHFETEKFAKRVFDSCTPAQSKEYLDWQHFLLAVKAIQARNID